MRCSFDFRSIKICTKFSLERPDWKVRIEWGEFICVKFMKNLVIWQRSLSRNSWLLFDSFSSLLLNQIYQWLFDSVSRSPLDWLYGLLLTLSRWLITTSKCSLIQNKQKWWNSTSSIDVILALEVPLSVIFSTWAHM